MIVGRALGTQKKLTMNNESKKFVISAAMLWKFQRKISWPSPVKKNTKNNTTFI